MEQSMTMSMFSSITPDEFNQEEDLYGKQILKSEAYTKGVQRFVYTPKRLHPWTGIKTNFASLIS